MGKLPYVYISLQRRCNVIRKLVPVLLLFVAVTATGIVGAVGVGPMSSAVADVAGMDDAKPPALVSFTSAGAKCTDEFRANSSSSVAGGGANTHVGYSRNVSLDDPANAIGGPTFERTNESAYALHVPVETTKKAPRDCPGVARYEANMRIPAGDDPWTILVYHDGEHVTTLFGDSDSSPTGSSVSSGQHVSN